MMTFTEEQSKDFPYMTILRFTDGRWLQLPTDLLICIKETA